MASEIITPVATDWQCLEGQWSTKGFCIMVGPPLPVFSSVRLLPFFLPGVFLFWSSFSLCVLFGSVPCLSSLLVFVCFCPVTPPLRCWFSLLALTSLPPCWFICLLWSPLYLNGTRFQVCQFTFPHVRASPISPCVMITLSGSAFHSLSSLPNVKWMVVDVTWVTTQVTVLVNLYLTQGWE